MEIIGEEGWDWNPVPRFPPFFTFLATTIFLRLQILHDTGRVFQGPGNWVCITIPSKTQDVIQLLGACCSIFVVRYYNKDSR